MRYHIKWLAKSKYTISTLSSSVEYSLTISILSNNLDNIDLPLKKLCRLEFILSL